MRRNTSTPTLFHEQERAHQQSPTPVCVEEWKWCTVHSEFCVKDVPDVPQNSSTDLMKNHKTLGDIIQYEQFLHSIFLYMLGALKSNIHDVRELFELATKRLDTTLFTIDIQGIQSPIKPMTSWNPNHIYIFSNEEEIRLPESMLTYGEHKDYVSMNPRQSNNSSTFMIGPSIEHYERNTLYEIQQKQEWRTEALNRIISWWIKIEEKCQAVLKEESKARLCFEAFPNLSEPLKSNSQRVTGVVVALNAFKSSLDTSETYVSRYANIPRSPSPTPPRSSSPVPIPGSSSARPRDIPLRPPSVVHKMRFMSKFRPNNHR